MGRPLIQRFKPRSSIAADEAAAQVQAFHIPFPIAKSRDEAPTEEQNPAGEVLKPGRYLTKYSILEIYDSFAESMQTGRPYQTRALTHLRQTDTAVIRPKK